MDLVGLESAQRFVGLIEAEDPGEGGNRDLPGRPILFSGVSPDGISWPRSGSPSKEVTAVMDQKRQPVQVKADLRRGVRVPFDGHADIRCGAERRVARIRNVSFSGCFLEMRPPYTQGANLALSFELDQENARPLRANAKVTRTTDTGVAVRFAYIDVMAPRALKQWIDSRKPAL